MEESINVKEINLRISFLIGMVLGTVVFLIIYGVQVLDVTNIDYLFNYEQDPAQHYLGWQLYRNSGWHFPIGLCDNSMYPEMASVVYTDSIPLFCLVFKLISPILPKSFQFIGLYGLLCYMLQGGFAKLLLRKYIKSEVACSLGSLLFIINISFIQRIFLHTALGSHFLILAGMVLFAYRKDFSNMKKRVLLWVLLGVVSVLLHVYIYGMISIMLVGYALVEAVDNENRVLIRVRDFVIYIVSYLTSSVFVFYLFGGFYGDVEVQGIGLGEYSANINTLINPQGYSLFFGSLPIIASQSDGLCYLGISGIILLIIGIVSIIKNHKTVFSGNKKVAACIFIVTLMIWIFALSPVVALGDSYVDYSFLVPEFIEKLWGIFRSTGRFMWPIGYLVMMIGIVNSERLLKRFYSVLLVILVILQFVEYSPYMIGQHKLFNEYEHISFTADAFEKYDFSEYKHIQFMKGYSHIDYYSSEDCYNILTGYTKLAIDKGLTVSNFHFSRDYKTSVENQIMKSYEELLSGNPDKETIYIFEKNEYVWNGLSGVFDNVSEIDTGEEIILIPVK